MLPLNSYGNFMAGDFRSGENVALTSLHTIFVLEHNRIACKVIKHCSSLNDEDIFRIARNFVIGLLQKISYYDYLPQLFRPSNWNKYIGNYTGYKSGVNPGIYTEYATTAFRITHALINNVVKLVNKEFKNYKTLTLHEAFAPKPDNFTDEKMSDVLRGLTQTTALQRTHFYVD